MTVGYGDAVTTSPLGQLISSIAMIVSVLILALPSSVIGANFNTAWAQYSKQKRTSSVGGNRRRKLATHFSQLGRMLLEHNIILDEIISKIHTTANDLDELVTRTREKVTNVKTEIKKHEGK